jgi:hypothetical protein
MNVRDAEASFSYPDAILLKDFNHLSSHSSLEFNGMTLYVFTPEHAFTSFLSMSSTHRALSL